MKPYKTPNRKYDSVSQSYNDGIVRICTVTDTAAPGDMPVEEPIDKYKLMYAEQRVGITRYYTAQQYHEDVERVIRVQKVAVQKVAIETRDIAITEDGRRYSISMVQSVDDVYPPSLDLTLTKIK